MMSKELKTEIAKELGVYDTVASEGWGDKERLETAETL